MTKITRYRINELQTRVTELPLGLRLLSVFVTLLIIYAFYRWMFN